MSQPFKRVGVVGSGAMGRGIVQIFAQAGLPVRVHDSNPAAIDAAVSYVSDTFAKLVEKGRLGAEQAAAASARLVPSAALEDLADCDLVIEAIVERLDVKRELFRRLEAIVAPDAVLASNTSSLSITAIAAGCERPGRVAGYHFFNPVPLMRIVEVIDGARTEPGVAARLCELAKRAGHHAVVARDTPGFIVNHAGRGYGTEALKALGEGVADTAAIDRIMREQVSFDGQGFKLGPFELLDLTGLDVSQPVMESIYRQFYEEPRFRPSVTGAQRQAAGLLGRKTGEGFYRYADGRQQAPAEPPVPSAVLPAVWVAPGERAGPVRELVAALGATLEAGDRPSSGALVLVAPLGVDATTAAVSAGLPAERTVAIDTLFPIASGQCQRRVLMATPATLPEWRDAAHALFASDGVRVTVLRDSAGFVAQRVVAMIVAIACEIAQQRIASPEDIDAAVKAGLGYPLGPLSMGDRVGASTIAAILDGMHAVTQDPRYRPSPWLRRRALLGLSLRHGD